MPKKPSYPWKAFLMVAKQHSVRKPTDDAKKKKKKTEAPY